MRSRLTTFPCPTLSLRPGHGLRRDFRHRCAPCIRCPHYVRTAHADRVSGAQRTCGTQPHRRGPGRRRDVIEHPHDTMVIQWPDEDALDVVSVPEWEPAGHDAHTPGATDEEAVSHGREVRQPLSESAQEMSGKPRPQKSTVCGSMSGSYRSPLWQPHQRDLGRMWRDEVEQADPGAHSRGQEGHRQEDPLGPRT